MSESVTAVILAGGSGTRFWPASRSARPKQLLPLTGGAPLLLETAHRVLPLVGGWDHILIAGGKATEAPTRALLADLPSENLLVEPAPRNTAACIAWASSVVARKDPNGLVMVLPSDHHVADIPGFRRALETALAAARGGLVTTLGIKPTRPETGFGYIELAEERGSYTLARRFVEKPDRTTAEAYLAGGKHLWNAGMFIFRAKDMLAAVAKHLPAISAALEAFDRAASEGREQEEVAKLFPTLPSVSIDVGIMEKLPELAVVPADIGWSDIGSWQAAWELAEKDADGNSRGADLLAIEARGNHVVDATSTAPKKLIAILGVDDLVVVETDDALLVAPRERSQDVRLVIEALKKQRSGLL